MINDYDFEIRTRRLHFERGVVWCAKAGFFSFRYMFAVCRSTTNAFYLSCMTYCDLTWDLELVISCLRILAVFYACLSQGGSCGS